MAKGGKSGKPGKSSKPGKKAPPPKKAKPAKIMKKPNLPLRKDEDEDDKKFGKKKLKK